MRTADEVRSIINRAFTWDRKDGTENPPSTFAAFDGTDDGQFVTADELALVDKRLPHVLRDILSTLDEKKTVGIHGSWATTSLQHWEKPLLKVRKSDGSECLVAHVNAIERHPVFPESEVYWAVFRANPKELEIETGGVTEVVTYIYYTVADCICVKNDWMDENYPGWNERMSLLEAVGSTPSELVAAVLSSPVQHQPLVSLSEVSFG